MSYVLNVCSALIGGCQEPPFFCTDRAALTHTRSCSSRAPGSQYARECFVPVEPFAGRSVEGVAKVTKLLMPLVCVLHTSRMLHENKAVCLGAGRPCRYVTIIFAFLFLDVTCRAFFNGFIG